MNNKKNNPAPSEIEEKRDCLISCVGNTEIVQDKDGVRLRVLLEQERFKHFMEEYLKLTKAERALYVAHLKLLDAKFQAAHEKAALGGAGRGG